MVGEHSRQEREALGGRGGSPKPGPRDISLVLNFLFELFPIYIASKVSRISRPT